MTKNVWFDIWVITLLLAIMSGDLIHQSSYDTGYEIGRAETPANVIAIDRVIIDTVEGKYRFSVISGNQTFSVIEKKISYEE